MNKPHISESKKRIINELKKLCTSYSLIGIADLRNLPSKQLQSMRSKLKNNLLMLVTKKRLIKIALDQIKEKRDLSNLLPYINMGMPLIIFSNEDPFSLYRKIKKCKSKAPAKPGQISPADLKIEAGPTNFPPGPIIGELGQLGIIAAVENGKVCIKKEKLLVKQGEAVTSATAQVLSKLNIEPMEIGLNVLVIMGDEGLYEKAVLDIDEEKIKQDLMSAHKDAFLLALSIPYITQETIKPLIQKASREGTTLSEKLSEKGIVTSGNIKAQIIAAESEARTVEKKLPLLPEPEEKAKEEETKEEKQKPEEQKQEKPQIKEKPQGKIEEKKENLQIKQKQEKPQEEKKQESPSKQIKEKPTREDLPKGLEIMDDPGTTKEDVIKENLKKADYGRDSEIAKKVLQEIKDKGIREKEGEQGREAEKPLQDTQKYDAQAKRESAKDSKKEVEEESAVAKRLLDNLKEQDIRSKTR
ncbi:MAG: 50S ribosomal protein L10 [Nanoarchaeota archaeon]|nr:50S ribosomal protein L10 [Nanoarchaeota archaeon]